LPTPSRLPILHHPHNDISIRERGEDSVMGLGIMSAQEMGT
jgi:hypothetical protein